MQERRLKIMSLVTGSSDEADVAAVTGTNTAQNGSAGVFEGNVSVTGNLNVAGSPDELFGVVHITGGVTATGTVLCTNVVCLSNDVEQPGVSGSNTAGGNAGQFDGNVAVTGSVTAHDMILDGMDCAEEFDVTSGGKLEPGTVVVFDGDGAISQSEEPYNKRVAGVISGAGEYHAGLILGRNGSSGEGKAPVALMGRVYCKVDANASPIAVGDLLTTSSTPGHAMKVTDPLKGFGSVVGKALRSLDSGRGLLPILVTLQ
jgi:hypothetical protein